jgi:hypothetical protein
MSRSQVEQVADAILYEGYILYPYRPSSVKNRQRWTFGGVYPRAYSESQTGADAWQMRTECLLAGGPDALLSVRVRFLHLLERLGGERSGWQEATEREVICSEVALRDLEGPGQTVSFAYPASRDSADRDVWQQEFLAGEVERSVQRLAEGLFRVAVVVRNIMSVPPSVAFQREQALRHTFVSTHSILHVRGGEFVSLLDPPGCWQEHATACRNAGTYPVLAGEEGSKDTMLSSPIILYDYPQVADQSPGDLFDATEIDEILTLRILTLTDQEKAEMAAADERARALLARTEGLAADDLVKLHGGMRSLRPPTQEGENDG